MLIVHVVRQYYPLKGGLETSVHNLAAEQVVAGHKVRVVTLNKSFKTGEILSFSDMVDGVEIVRIPYFGSSRYPIAPTVITHLAHADIVHVHALDFFCDFLALYSIFTKKILILTTHGGFFHTQFASRLKKFWFANITRLTLRSYSAVICVSEQDLLTFSAIRKTNIHLIHNPIDVRKFRPDLPQDRNAHQLIAINRFSTNKRVDRLLDFVAALEKNDRWNLTLIGTEGDLTRSDVEKLIADRGLTAQVELLIAPDDKTIKKRLTEASVFLSASSYEGFGIAAIEASSAGLNCVLNDIPTYNEIVRGGDNGIIVDFDSPSEAASKFHKWWLTKPGSAAKITQIIEYSDNFSVTSVQEKIAGLYSSILDTQKRHICGLNVSVLGLDEAKTTVDKMIENGHSNFVFFANSNLLTTASAELKGRIRASNALILNDGVALDAASLILYGRTFPGNLNGTDFVPHFLENSAADLKIYLLGAKSHVVKKTVDVLNAKYPRHRIVGWRDGFFREDDTAALIESIRMSNAQLLLCAMGNPRQEEWLLNNLDRNAPITAMAVGAFFDFESGDVARAPLLMRIFKLEWIFRLFKEPKRLYRRYTIGVIVFFVSVLNQFLRHNLRGR